jgi:hypothetical protein
MPSQSEDSSMVPRLLWLLPLIYFLGYVAIRLSGQAVVFNYGTGDRELWSNVDRVPHFGPALQRIYMPLLRGECTLRHLKWSP